MRTMYVDYYGLSPTLKREVDLLQLKLESCNKKIEYGFTIDIYNELKEAIGIFNYGQKYDLIHGYSGKSRKELLEYYVRNNTYIRAEEYRSVKRFEYENKYHCYHTVRYQEKVMPFTELLKYSKLVSTEEKLLEVFSTCAYYIYENFKESKIIALQKYRIDDMKNPYAEHDLYWLKIKITKESFSSKNSIKKTMAKIVAEIFPTETVEIIGILQKTWLEKIAEGASVKHLIDQYFIRYANILNNKKTIHEKMKGISRHTNWCIHKHDGWCSITNQPCDTSVKCAFYVGYKTNNNAV